MSVDDAQVFECEPAGRWFCVVTCSGIKVGVELAETVVGAGDWCVMGLEVRPVEGVLTVATLRDAPYGTAIRRARAEVEKVAARRGPLVFARPSDPPLAFRADRRGRVPRIDMDYAQLAWSYLALGKEVRRHAAAIWAERFPEGGGKRTWLNRLVRAKRFVEEDALTDEGMALVFGDEWQDRFESDGKWGSALNVATMIPGGEIWRTLQLEGKDPREWQRSAQQIIRVDAHGRLFPRHSP